MTQNTHILMEPSIHWLSLSNPSLNSWGMGTNGQLGTGEEEDVWEPYLITSKQIKDR